MGELHRESANKQIVRAFVDAMNARDFATLDRLVAPDVIRTSPSTPDVVVTNLDEFMQFLRQDLEGVPDSVQEIRQLVAEGEWVAVWANYAGTQEGPLGPFPPSGKRVDTDFAGFLRIADGKIAEIRAVWDSLNMLTQLGHMSPPAVSGED